MTDQDIPVSHAGRTWDSETQQVVAAQRAALHTAFGERGAIPQVGEVWLSGAHWGGTEGSTLTAMLVVLRSFSEVWSAQPLFDVAPVSEDERLASEWSLIFDAPHSGLGLPLVMHVDVQSTTASSMLVQRIGPLSAVARRDLEALMRAYAMSDGGPVALDVGRRGSLSIRFHPEWEDFARELVALSQAFSAPLALERLKQEAEGGDSPCDEESTCQLLAVASGAEVSPGGETTQHGTWEYRAARPFVYCLDGPPEPIPKRLGEAIALYYVQHSGSGTLDAERFGKLVPYLDAPLSGLVTCNSQQLRTTLSEFLGHGGADPPPAFDVLDIILASVRQARRTIGLTKGTQPMRLAARRPTPD